MPLQLDYVLSDAKHYSPFVCKLCSMLTSYHDAVVTTPCNHVFCLPCMETWIQQESEGSSNPCKCPCCPTEIEHYDDANGAPTPTMLINNLPIKIQKLAVAQPLAHQILGQVQVSCTNAVHGDQVANDCAWTGDYSQLTEHDYQPDGSGPSAAAVGATTSLLNGMPLNGVPAPQSSKQGLSFDDARRSTHRGEITGAHHHRNIGNGNKNSFDPQELRKASERCDKLKKQANAKFNRGDVEGARLLYSEGLALISVFPIDNDEVRKLTASLYSNRAVTYFRERILEPSIEDCNRSLELDPLQEKTYIRKWRALTALGDMEEALNCLHDGVQALPKSRKLAEEYAKAKDAPPPPAASVAPSVMDMSVAVSVASRSVYTSHPSKGNELDRAEKLKKQANAKFNKGDIESARALYTESLNCIPGINQLQGSGLANVHQMFSPEVCDLMAMLYSNRAVTYYRDKQYRESLGDCEKAVKLDPKAEKSYIRKSRALAGLELHEEACKCLEEAAKILPKSKKIPDELEKAQDKLEEDMLRATGGAGAGDDHMSVAGFTMQGIDNVRNKDYSEDLELADKLKRNANAKFNRGDIAGARLLYTEALACLPNDHDNPEVRACLASLYANRAVTYFREKEFDQSVWDCDKAIQLDPRSEKSYIRKARALVSVSRADEAVDCLEEGMQVVENPGRLEEELSKAREQLRLEGNAFDNGLSEQQRNDFMVSSQNVGHEGDYDDQFFVSPPRDKLGLGAVNEGQTEEYPIPYSSDEDLERADKLKKQANAKLNKGDVAGARILYGEGLACLSADGPKSEEGRELAASLYANRAVTFFREKKFAATVSDCDKSLELDPKHEKSYIRKWRALMALGDFDESFLCLQKAVEELPDSERLTEELGNAKEQKELLTTMNGLIENGDYHEARDTLRPLVKTSDNVTLWLVAARVDACLGMTESALERVSKVLMFNPRNTEAQQVKGYALFLTGDMESGISVLRDALDAADEETPSAQQQLEYCQQTFAAFTKGQARVKRGRYKEAVDLFSSAMEDGVEIPKDAPLYGLLLTERAEASLLAQLYEESLDDCNEAIELKYDNMTAWTVKVEVYFALGRLKEARGELAQVRKTWGAGNETIEEAYKKTDFELRLQRADDELHQLVESIESNLPGGMERKLERRPSRAGSSRGLLGRKGASSHNTMGDRESESDRRSRKSKNSKRSSSTSRRKDRKTRPHQNGN
mmetsp:Transcript_28614/g.80666  ORF Transcript_28614/g.80666 Transcript_28614/m.80666 type:complete len:1218 (-) Transcript_28614:236-3889(-)|eukprot:CAMPEP_0119556118 /NCGR_PEP_ID=MMETSP1352-20130426/8153_1 /TAXON_ID=265584 /ORGANISM="Stauroneis constricta, Strain CCMP1120" /LENGTH=1217 /DNA_ID=CAMNT_0007603019 /DNA_START=699 /DNA_END=4352 /DNA_ORIENTATION=+